MERRKGETKGRMAKRKRENIGREIKGERKKGRKRQGMGEK